MAVRVERIVSPELVGVIDVDERIATTGLIHLVELGDDTAEEVITPLDIDEEETPLNNLEALLDTIDEPTDEELNDPEIAQLVAEAQKETQAGLDALAQMSKAAGRRKLLTAAREVELAKRIEAGDQEAKNEMIEANMRLVISLAKRHRHKGLEFTDVIQEGTLGLIRAVEKFDWRRGYKFSTYATWWIRQACQRGNYDRGKAIRIPVHVNERRAELNKQKKELTQTLGREPTLEEMAAEARMKIGDAEVAWNLPEVTASLDKPLTEESKDGLLELQADPNADDPEESAVEAYQRRVIREQLGVQLDERERDIVLWLHASEGKPPTLGEVGKKYGISLERVRQIDVAALTKLFKNPVLRQAILGEELPEGSQEYTTIQQEKEDIRKKIIDESVFEPIATLSNAENAVISLILENGHRTYTTISSILDVSPSTVKNYIYTLKKQLLSAEEIKSLQDSSIDNLVPFLLKKVDYKEVEE